MNRCGITGSSECSPGDFTIKVTGNNPSLASFPGSATGTKVTLGPGQYEVSETGPITRSPSFSGNCIQVGNTASATGTIVAGGTQNCTITNDVS